MTGSWHDEVLMVIPSVNGAELLRRMLPTLRFTPGNVAVLDQGSTDDTEAVCREAGVVMVQLGRPHTYTEAGNIGARMARQRGCLYVCISNNDITFRTDVIGAMRDEMRRDPSLGIVAPSQVIIDPATGEQSFTSRVYWDLDRIDFLHDSEPVDPAVERLEADFCELTCALVRMSAIAEIGFLDDEYGFYHEDADFGFRLRAAGYTTAYLPQAQIDHFTSSTFGRELPARKREFLAKNRRHFTAKHLGYGVRPSLPSSAAGGAWDGFGADLPPTLLRQGLVEVTAPELVMGPPGIDSAGYDYTDVNVPVLPPRWLRHASRYRAVFTATDRMRAVFAAAGFPHCFHVPPGVDPDVFHPWGTARRTFAEPTVLAFADGWQTGWLSELLGAWRGLVASGRPGWLVVMGQGLSGAGPGAPDWRRNTGGAEVSRFSAERIEFHDGRAALLDVVLAETCRGADFVLPNPADAALHLPLLRAMGCSLPCIAGTDAVLAELVPEEALRFAPGGLQRVLEEALGLSNADRARLGRAAMYKVRAAGTLRQTTAGLHSALSRLQVRDPAAALARIRDRQATELLTAAPVAGGGSGMGRRVKAAGRLALMVGSAWEEKGLAAARATLRTELGYFLGKRGRAPAEPAAVPAPASPPPPAASGKAEPPVAGSTLVVGYIDGQLGLGTSVRGLARAMDTAGCRFAILPVGLGIEGRRGEPFMPERYDTVRPHAVNVVEVTVDELPKVRAHVGEYHFERSYNILRTYWELARAPASWRPNLVGIQEIWAPTRFIAESFRAIFEGPITVVPPCVDLPPASPEAVADGRTQFGLEPGRFHFLFSFDYHSFPQRKNPLGVVRAFRRAFPDPQTPVGLLVKSTGAAGHFPAVKQALREAARRDGRITVIDESLSGAEMLALLTAADCYVSLHRAEGFGLGMAEAMALGKPVIGTDYSGSTDFLSAATGFPVACTLRPLRPDDYVHPTDQVWAEPDEDACAVAMRAAFSDKPGTASLAAAGQRFIHDHFGPEAVGATVSRRLAEIATRPATP